MNIYTCPHRVRQIGYNAFVFFYHPSGKTVYAVFNMN